MDETRLEHGPNGLELRSPSDRPGQGVQAAPFEVVRRGTAGHPLVRVLGSPPGTVLDATAGFGVDAGVAAHLGFDVTLIERNRDLFTLLEDAISTPDGPEEEAIAARLTLRFGDACELLPTLAPDVLMIDPMFPARRRSSALPPKPMQRLRSLLRRTEPDDVVSLLDAAQRSKARRIVLKRPPDAVVSNELLGTPTFSIETKLLRWDVWERSVE
jgi:16S rRNA (guanine1516-N2)-methyltransferase